MPDVSRYRWLSLAPAEVVIAPREVARLAKAGPVAGCAAPIADAIAEAHRLIEPRGVWTSLTPGEAEALFVEPTPVSRIVEGRQCWAFLATIGGALEARVQEHFAAAHFLEGVLLDAAGSAAADALAECIELACVPDRASERFSSGYCSWAMSGQSPLFALMQPDELGVQLLPSFLMYPLKSVSGIVVRGPAAQLRVDPNDCAQCAARGCERRQAAEGAGLSDI